MVCFLLKVRILSLLFHQLLLNRMWALTFIHKNKETKTKITVTRLLASVCTVLVEDGRLKASV